MPMTLSSIKQTWFFNIRGDVLAGLVVALALIPEAIAFSIIAGVDPKVGLYASFSMAVVIAFAGGRPGIISAATGAMAARSLSARQVKIRAEGVRRRLARAASRARRAGRAWPMSRKTAASL